MYDCGSLDCAILTEERKNAKNTGGRVAVGCRKIWNRTNELKRTVTAKEGIRHKAWMVPAPFLAMQYIKNGR